RRSVCADESAAHAVAGAEQGPLPRCALRAVLSKRLSRAASPVPRGRVAGTRGRCGARADARRAAGSGRARRRRAHARKPSRPGGHGARVFRGGHKMIVDVLIPTYGRPAALAVTMTSLCAQTLRPFRVVVSDQTDRGASIRSAEV